MVPYDIAKRPRVIKNVIVIETQRDEFTALGGLLRRFNRFGVSTTIVESFLAIKRKFFEFHCSVFVTRTRTWCSVDEIVVDHRRRYYVGCKTIGHINFSRNYLLKIFYDGVGRGKLLLRDLISSAKQLIISDKYSRRAVRANYAVNNR